MIIFISICVLYISSLAQQRNGWPDRKGSTPFFLFHEFVRMTIFLHHDLHPDSQIISIVINYRHIRCNLSVHLYLCEKLTWGNVVFAAVRHGGGQRGESTLEHRPTFSTNPGGVTVTGPKPNDEKRLFLSFFG